MIAESEFVDDQTDEIVEVDRLTYLEARIEQGLTTFIDVGEALLEIRDDRLYKDTHSDFDAYCRERWGFSRVRSTQMISAANIAAKLVTTVTTPLPANERQYRELARIPEHHRARVWENLVAEHGTNVTAEIIREAANRPLIVPASEYVKLTGFPEETYDDDEDYDEPVADEWVRPRPASVPTPFVHVSQNSGENEWYTPPDYIAAAREVLGEIDLDPASSPIANRTVGATEYYTKDDNGLARAWYGRVWLNPPYAQPLIQHFVERMVEHVASGDVAEAIVLVNNATDTRWFQLLAKHAAAVCFPRGRIRYLDKTGQPALTPLQGQAFLYCGINRDVFERVFSQFGVVL